jgi:hypothetical protein
MVRTIAAYRDRHGITGGDPLGPAPSGQGQRLDYQRASIAGRRAQATANEDVRQRHGPGQQVDSSRGVAFVDAMYARFHECVQTAVQRAVADLPPGPPAGRMRPSSGSAIRMHEREKEFDA